ncbi:hypothetical protein B9Z48_00425 [Limnohabitans sp. WS1]|nr:hypothetical protein B9Z48_00425 [Limnohabitans sp. WS1]
MLKVMKILVMLHVLVGGAAVLSACGQKGPLFLPTAPESAGRASLPQSLNPWHTVTPGPSGQAPATSSPPAPAPALPTPASPVR